VACADLWTTMNMGGPLVAPVGGGGRHKAVACSFAARWKNQREDGVAAGLLD
jgi:hypothetical protein